MSTRVAIRAVLACLALGACGVGDFTFDGRSGNIDASMQLDAARSIDALDARVGADTSDDTAHPDSMPQDSAQIDASDIVATDVLTTDAVAETFGTDASDVNCAASCINGSCATGSCVCPAGSAHCGTICTNLQSDPMNCAACGRPCTPAVCTNGACGCPASQMYCGGACIDVIANPAHCGNCTTACTGGMTCQQSRCACPASTTICTDGTCQACPGVTSGTSRCAGGACSVACFPGYAPATATLCCSFVQQYGYAGPGTRNETLTLTAGSYGITGTFSGNGSLSIGTDGTGTFTDMDGCIMNVALTFSTDCHSLTVALTNTGGCGSSTYLRGTWTVQ